MQIKTCIRKTKKQADGKYTIQFSFAHNGKTTYRSSGIYVLHPKNLKHGQIVSEPNATYHNTKLLEGILAYQKAYDSMPDTHQTQSVYEIVNYIENKKQIETTPFVEFAEPLAYGHATKEYAIKKFKTIFPNITIAAITKETLDTFSTHLENTGISKTTIGICLRELKALYHTAQDKKLVSRDIDPFFKYKIAKGNKREIALTTNEIQRIRNCQPASKMDATARDIFMIIFYLGGINMKDLFTLPPIQNDHINYRRAKTINSKDDDSIVSLAIQPELLPYIERYKGTDTLFDFGYKCNSHKALISIVNRGLKNIAAQTGISICLSTYIARHSWATIADELGINQNVIDYTLGHSIKGMGMNYIHRRYKAADEAMRKVLDAINDAT
jgi:integrase